MGRLRQCADQHQSAHPAYQQVPGFNPLQLLDSPHNLVIAPTMNLPFGENQRYLTSGWANVLLGGWSVTPVITFNSAFPVGISQTAPTATFLMGGTPRPNSFPACPSSSTATSPSESGAT